VLLATKAASTISFFQGGRRRSPHIDVGSLILGCTICVRVSGGRSVKGRACSRGRFRVLSRSGVSRGSCDSNRSVPFRVRKVGFAYLPVLRLSKDVADWCSESHSQRPNPTPP